jgi:hypothetical protein
MYILTFANGQVLKFYVQTCAEIFQQCWGGQLTYVEVEHGQLIEE